MARALPVIGAIIAAALLPTLTSSCIDDTRYAVTVSSQLTGGSVEILCVQLYLPHKNPCSVRLRVKIQMPGKKRKTPILEEGVTSQLTQCFDFQVPTVKTRTVANISVEINGDRKSVTKTTKVLIVPPAFVHIITSDKPIYKPGQTIRFRIVFLSTDFLPLKRVYELVELADSDSNRIAQWLNVSNTKGILDLSHLTAPEAMTGTYTITASTNKGEKTTHSLKVEKFVLPKFEVVVQMPRTVTVFHEEITFRVCGKYTYGKPVNGLMAALFCKKGFQFWWVRAPDRTPKCKTFKQKTDKSGCASQKVNMTEFFITKDMFLQYFEVTAEMTESGTGTTLTGSGKMYVSNKIRSLRFENLPPNYRRGLEFSGKVKLTGPDDKPVANEKVFLSISPLRHMATLTTDSKGMANFSFDTSIWSGRISVTARPDKPIKPLSELQHNLRPRYDSAYHTALEFYSKSNSFVKLLPAYEDLSCDVDVALQAQYIINNTELLQCQDNIKFFYLVLSKGELKRQGFVDTSVVNGVGKLSFKIGRVVNLAPVAQVVIYTPLKSGELVADSLNYPIQLCFQNKVSLKFSRPQQLPAAKIKLCLKAKPDSLCSVRAIDKSVLLLEKEKDLTVDSVFNQLPLQILSGYSYDTEDDDHCPIQFPFPFPLPRPQPLPVVQPEPEPVVELVPEPVVEPVPEPGPRVGPPPLPGARPRARRSLRLPQFHRERNDVYSVFKDMGIKIVTNMDVKKPCSKSPPNLFVQPLLVAGDAVPRAPLAAPEASRAKSQDGQETIRSSFPDTWIWDLVNVGDNGKTDMYKKVPDSITEWVAGAFCVSPVGFGISPNTALTVFKPFFVSLTLPYSLIRGESFKLKATVFNHLPKCTVVKVTLADSDQYKFKKCNGCQYTMCLCSGESETFTWTVTPVIIGQVSLRVSAEAVRNNRLCRGKPSTVPKKGRIDTVIRKLLVEAEGLPQYVSHSALLCPAEEEPKEERFSLVLPDNFVEGSVKASVSVLGDLMGRPLKNIDKLLQMPFGCGEQNMLKFAPNVYILDYLSSTRQLTVEIKDRAILFLNEGYQRELNFKHKDGAYSAFGQRDKVGNTCPSMQKDHQKAGATNQGVPTLMMVLFLFMLSC